ncbi:glycosyltransferase family 2 protein [Microvirga pudoricolor]|uniref:glycosyltransferase family 2 protein n=1 Tax=Microvirga pudoricolor TaxID=2778729 RepID=UPI00195120B6|nr:glycosyltransferase family 2 protein [Microvirga pudoricolor]MBM6592941.1 glycosyltransferase [Microvirga pudoricolor]
MTRHGQAGPSHPRVLPGELGFLAAHGVPPRLLRAVMAQAALANVSPDQVLLANGHVEPDVFYRALARDLRLPFLIDPRLSGATVATEAVGLGLAPLAGGGFVVAPRGRQIDVLRRLRPSGAGLALTTPDRFAKATLRAKGAVLAYRAANDLPDRAPSHSSRDGSSSWQIGALAGLSFGASFSVVGETGLGLGILAGLSGSLFFSAVCLRLATLLLASRVEPDGRAFVDEGRLPVYTVIVALYRERTILPQLVAALAALRYPAAKLDIKLVLEADDPDTLAALEAMRLPGFVSILVAPPGAPRTKPRALNLALPFAWGDLVVLYDAEDVPDPNQLRLAASLFARSPPEVACLQARLSIDNTGDSALTRLFTIEYASLFDVINPGLIGIGAPVLLGGTSNHFRMEALRAIGGWDAWNVTEDADLGIRLARLGYRVGDLPSQTLEEAPARLGEWMRQRTRWMKGFMQTCICHSRHPGHALRELGFWRFAGAVLVTAGTVASALGYPIFTALCLYAWNAPTPEGALTLWQLLSLELFVLGLIGMLAPALLGIKRRRLLRLLPWVPLLPLYYGLVSVAAWRALFELVLSPFHWHKTSHGHARTSRTGRLQKHQARADTTMSLKTTGP